MASNKILDVYNVDKDAFSAYIERRGYTLLTTGADGNEIWNAPDDKPGDTSLTIKFCGKKYTVYVHTEKANPLERKGRYSFSDARMKFEGIDATELTRRLIAEGYSGQTDDKHSSLAVRQAKAKPTAKAKQKYQFPYEIRLDGDSLFIESIKTDVPGVVRRGDRLKQDDLMKSVYIGGAGTDVSGNPLIEHLAFLYCTADGQPASLTYRVRSRGKDGEKEEKGVRLYSFTNAGTFRPAGVKKGQRRLFNEQAIKDAQTVFFVEGERCVYDLQRFLLEHGIKDAGVVTSGGSNDVNADLVREAIGGKTVYILPDNDEPGYKYALQVKNALLGTGSTVQVWKWNDETEAGYDVSDVLAERRDSLTVENADLSSFFRSLDGLSVGNWTDGVFLSDGEKKADDDGSDEDISETLADLYADNPQMPPFIVPDLIYENDSVVVNAGAGVGKTWFVASLAYAVATGTSFLERYKALNDQKNVYFINPEMSRATLNERLQTFTKDPLDNIRFLHWDIVRDKMKQHPTINLADEYWLKFLERDIQKYKIDMLIVDSLHLCYYPDGVSSNAAESARPFNDLMLMCRDNSCSLVAVLHDGKDPTKEGRGTSAMFDMPELSLKLSRPQKRVSNGREAEFNVSFGSKNRNGVPETPFYARRDRINNCWITSNAAEQRQAEQEDQQKKDENALTAFRNGKTPDQLQEAFLDYQKYPEEDRLKKLFTDNQSSIIKAQLERSVPLRELLQKYDQKAVRKTYLELNENAIGAACAALFEAGDPPDLILRSYRAQTTKNAKIPRELTEAVEKKWKTEFFEAFDDGQRRKELYSRYSKKIVDAHYSRYFEEWTDERTRQQLEKGVDVLKLLAARLPDGNSQYDRQTVAAVYIRVSTDKQKTLETISSSAALDGNQIKKVAAAFNLTPPRKRPGRPRKEKSATRNAAAAKQRSSGRRSPPDGERRKRKK